MSFYIEVAKPMVVGMVVESVKQISDYIIDTTDTLLLMEGGSLLFMTGEPVALVEQDV